MRILGVDYGTKRTGLAVGDVETLLAFPLRTVSAPTLEKLVVLVLAAAAEEKAERVVVGMPVRLSGLGKPGDTERSVAAFVEALRRSAELPVETEDERLTTAAVERRRKDAGIKKSDFDRDAAAAAAILETYMERLRQGTGR